MTADRPRPARAARTVGDLVARERRAGAPALRSFAAGDERTLRYRDCVTTAAKAGNVLRHLGVRGRGAVDAAPAPDDRTDAPAPWLVAVAPDLRPEPLLAFLGAAAVGAVVRVDPDAGAVRVCVVSADEQGAYGSPPGTTLVVYGGDPAASGTVHWESEVWSENPATPPVDVGPDDPAVVADRHHTHAELLAAARTVVDRLDLAPGDGVALRASLADPRAVAAGVLAPLLAGGVVVLPDGEPRAGVAVGDGPEPTSLSPDDVSL